MLIQIAGRNAWLNYHHLYYFFVIANEGSISAAAEKLKLGQPTLSAQLKQFEETIGVALFERHHKRLELNEAGRMVQQYAAEIFRMGSEMLEVVQDGMPARQRTHVSIGALDSVPKHVTLELAKTAMAHSSCSISILEGRPDELLRELQGHKIDLIVSNFEPSLLEGRGLHSRRISRAPVVVCGSQKYRKLSRDFPRSLHQQPFVLATGHSKLRHDFEHYLRLSGLQVDVVAETQDTALQKLMGIHGLGLVVMPMTAVEEPIRTRDLFKIGELDGVSEEIYLVSASRKFANPVSSAIMKSFLIGPK